MKLKPNNGMSKYLKGNGVSLVYYERKVKLDLKKRLGCQEYMREYNRLSKLFDKQVKKYVYEHYPSWPTSEYILITAFAANLIRSELMSKKENLPEGIEKCLKDAVNSLEMPSYE